MAMAMGRCAVGARFRLERRPLDINVQGLVETDFQQDYWEEVVKDYQAEKAQQEAPRDPPDKDQDEEEEEEQEEHQAAKEPREGRAVEKLKKCRELLYNFDGINEDTVEKVINDANDRYGEDTWMKAWQGLQEKYLPPSGVCEYNGHDIKAILERLEHDPKDNPDELKKHFVDGKNPIHDWITGLNEALSDIRDALAGRAAKK